MFPLDESESGLQARKLATDPKTAQNYILKPSLEGGGHNLYGSDIPKFLKKVKKELWGSYVLMEKIVPPTVQNVLMSKNGMFEGNVINELGVFGVCLWQQKKGDEGEGKKGEEGRVRAEIVQEMEPSWSMRTKNASVDEMSVVKGYGCFDSPMLVEKEVFKDCCHL
jgi:glutathione synthase